MTKGRPSLSTTSNYRVPTRGGRPYYRGQWPHNYRAGLTRPYYI